MIPPLVALEAAAEQIRTGTIDEVELHWSNETEAGCTRLAIIVRRTAQPAIDAEVTP